MPQFDITNFSSQIFWFALCFITLYIATSKIILPRIQAIIAARKNIVDADKISAEALNSQLEVLSEKTTNLRQKSSTEYQAKIDETLKSLALEKDKTLEELKIKIEEMNKKSRQDLQNFFENSKAQSAKLIQDLAQKIKSKILN